MEFFKTIFVRLPTILFGLFLVFFGASGLVTLLVIVFSDSEDTHSQQALSSGAKMWVTSDRLNRRTCPSTNCGVVGRLLFRETATILEEKGDWVRITKYYNAACKAGISEYVDTGNKRCSPENGIVKGVLAEWVAKEFLSTNRPPDPSAGARGIEKLIGGSDDFRRYKKEFVKAAETLLNSRQCTRSDFIEMGGWVKSSTQKSRPIYFTYCGGVTNSNRIYLNAKTGKIFR